VHDVVVIRQIQALRSVPGGRHVGRGRLLLDDDLGCWAARPAGRGAVRHEVHDVAVGRGHGGGVTSHYRRRLVST
jgi:hypothetical protein